MYEKLMWKLIRWKNGKIKILYSELTLFPQAKKKKKVAMVWENIRRVKFNLQVKCFGKWGKCKIYAKGKYCVLCKKYIFKIHTKEKFMCMCLCELLSVWWCHMENIVHADIYVHICHKKNMLMGFGLLLLSKTRILIC